jgi:HSP20 family protein
MADVKTNREQSLAKQEAPLPSPFFRPLFPFGRHFGLGPFGLMRALNEELDRAYRGGGSSGTKMEAWTPSVDVQHCNGNVVVTAELPGVKKEDVKVEMTDDALVIQGERRHEHKEDHEGFHSYERSYGTFFRSIPLPEGAKTDMAKAELTDGVLKVTVPATEAKKQPRQITVEQGKEGQSTQSGSSENKPTENKPTENKGTENKPTENKPTGTNPVAA